MGTWKQNRSQQRHFSDKRVPSENALDNAFEHGTLRAHTLNLKAQRTTNKSWPLLIGLSIVVRVWRFSNNYVCTVRVNKWITLSLFSRAGFSLWKNKDINREREGKGKMLWCSTEIRSCDTDSWIKGPDHTQTSQLCLLSTEKAWEQWHISYNAQLMPRSQFLYIIIYYSPLKRTKIPWRNSGIQVWGRKRTIWFWDILLFQNARKCSKNDGDLSKDTRTVWRSKLIIV